MAGELVKIQDNVTSSATDQALSANGGRFLFQTKLSLSGGELIASNADLNDENFLKAGNFVCTSNSTAQTVSNKPSGLTTAFVLRTYALAGNASEGNGTGTWQYRIQEIHEMVDNGDQIWRRRCSTGSTAGNWVFSEWKLITPEYHTYITTTAPTSSSADGIYLVI